MTNAAIPGLSDYDTPRYVRRRDAESFATLVERLSNASVNHADAYLQVPWDLPEHAIVHEDPRWILAPTLDPLATSEWYQDQTLETQARIGLYRITEFLKVGIDFERTLQVGLLQMAANLPTGSPLFRYIYHEVAEETQHSMMFNEFILRTGLDVDGLPKTPETDGHLFNLADELASLFFLFILSGEQPIDFLQRRTLEISECVHPLHLLICRLHVREEARHISFAREYIRAYVPDLGRRERKRLQYFAPRVVDVTRRLMHPGERFCETFGIPDEVFRESYQGPRGQALHHAATESVAQLCWEQGIVNDRLLPLWNGSNMFESKD